MQIVYNTPNAAGEDVYAIIARTDSTPWRIFNSGALSMEDYDGSLDFTTASMQLIQNTDLGYWYEQFPVTEPGTYRLTFYQNTSMGAYSTADTYLGTVTFYFDGTREYADESAYLLSVTLDQITGDDGNGGIADNSEILRLLREIRNKIFTRAK
jgi:hypothetical protein